LFVPKISGTITNAESLEVLKSYDALDSLKLTFVPVGGGQPRYANVNTGDLTFTVKLPPGKYKIGVSIETEDRPRKPGTILQIHERREIVNLLAVPSDALTCEVTDQPRQRLTINFGEGVRAARQRLSR